MAHTSAVHEPCAGRHCLERALRRAFINRDMYAVVLAAGRGTRMRPLTDRRPKPLLPVGDRSLLEQVFDTAIDVVDEFVVVIGYRGNAIKETIGDHYRGHPASDVRQDDTNGIHALLDVAPVVDPQFRDLASDCVGTCRTVTPLTALGRASGRIDTAGDRLILA